MIWFSYENTLGPWTLVFKKLILERCWITRTVTGEGVSPGEPWEEATIHPVTNPGFSSSRSSCWCQGGGSFGLHGLRVLAAPAEAERHHSEVHSVLLPPLPHGKWRITNHFSSVSQDLAAHALPSSPSHSAFLVVFLVMLSPHAEQSPHLHLTPEDSCFITWGMGARLEPLFIWQLPRHCQRLIKLQVHRP